MSAESTDRALALRDALRRTGQGSLGADSSAIMAVLREHSTAVLEHFERSGVIRHVEEGWWHPDVKGGAVHEHRLTAAGIPVQPMTMHRLCEPVFTHRQEPMEGQS